jgi:hypothetical protein
LQLLNQISSARLSHSCSIFPIELFLQRYEVNPSLVDRLEAKGLHFSGKNTDKSGERMEVIELSKNVHPYFIAAQFVSFLNMGNFLLATSQSNIISSPFSFVFCPVILLFNYLTAPRVYVSARAAESVVPWSVEAN